MSKLLGLLLAGGESRRMGRDKAALDYDGQPQLLRAFKLLQLLVDRVFVSLRAEQQAESLRSTLPQIHDHPGLSGPLAGIVAAQCAHPEVAWLVVACDLPNLDQATLANLIRQRYSNKLATAYASEHDGLPEPLCAIYEPTSAAALQAFIASGGHCPRKFLRSHDCQLLALPRAGTLDNINTPQELARELGRVAASRRQS